MSRSEEGSSGSLTSVEAEGRAADRLNAQRAAQNTDRELWREREGDFYADSLHVTQRGGIGINSGGRVIVKPVRDWHAEVARYQWLRDNLRGADFFYGDLGECVLVFSLPRDARVSADLDATIDALLQRNKKADRST